MKATELTLQQQAERCLGAAIRPWEWDSAKGSAESKLARIIEREGDADGARRESFYLAQLIAEAVKGQRFSKLAHDLMELANEADGEQFGVKKGQPASENARPPLNRPLL